MSVLVEETKAVVVVEESGSVAVVTETIPTVVEVGIRGPQGPSGGTSALYYEHTQNAPATVWTITHGQNAYPNVTIVDSAGTQVEGQIEYLSANQVRATFTAAFSGKAFFS